MLSKNVVPWLAAALSIGGWIGAAADERPSPVAVGAAEVESTATPDAAGEPAPAPAPQSANTAGADLGEVQREVDARLALVRSARDRLAALPAELDRQAQQLAAASEANRQAIAKLTIDLGEAAEGSPACQANYSSIVREVTAARLRLRRALDAWQDPSGVPVYAPDAELESLELASVHDRIVEIRSLESEIVELTAAARGREREVRWQALQSAGDAVAQLNRLRIAAIAKLSKEDRRRILGLSREGIGQMLREVEQLALEARLYRVTRLAEIRAAGTLTGDIFVIGSATYALLRLALVIAAVLVVRPRWRGWLDQLRHALFRSARSVRAKRRVQSWIGLATTLAPNALLIGAVLAVRWALQPVLRWSELDLVFLILVLYGLYRLAIDILVTLTERIAAHYRVRMAPEHRAKLVANVRAVVRVVTPLIVLLVVSQRLLGKGYLYSVVVEFAWLVVLVTFVGILVSWRRVAADAFVAVQPTGRLASFVRSTRDRWYGVFVAPASLAWAAGRAALAVGRDFALGFEQTRKALAFLFRQRIERQAEVRGYADGDLDRLPERVTAAFTEEPVRDGPLVIDRFPGLDVLTAAVAAWRERQRGGSFLLTGERGSGKSSWLNQLASEDPPVARIDLDRRITGAADLATVFGEVLAPERSTDGDLAALRDALLGGPPRIVVVDLAQHLFLAGVGGYAGFDAFTSLVEETQERVFWLCAMSGYAWRHLRAVRPTPMVFRHHVSLTRWHEEEIRALITTRLEASGLILNYSDLVVDRLEGVSARARLIESEEGYTRLLWDYADGNPRVALHFFLRSLVPEGPERARVRLFRAPPIEELEALDERALFTLAAVIVHENLTLTEVASVTRFPLELCRIHLHRLVELGVLGADSGRHRITTFWHRAAVRLLHRRSLLMD